MKYLQALFYTLLITVVAFSQGEYYMYNQYGERVYFIDNKEILYVQTNQENIKDLLHYSTDIDSLMPNIYKIKVKMADFYKCKEYLTSIENTYVCEELLSKKDNTVMYCFNKIFLQTKDDLDLQKILEELGIPYISYSPIGLMENEFLLEVKESNAFHLANLLYETNMFQYVVPVFYRQSINNPLYSSQWGLKNTGQNGGIIGIDINIEPAWQICDGNNVKIAVVDNGVQLDHPDLYTNLLTGYDAMNYGTNGGYLGTASHGTCCSGIIAAANNTIQIKGIAYNAKIIPIRVGLENNINDEACVRAFQYIYNHQVDIVSCSWGGGEESPTLTNAINVVVNNGRNGLGCPVLFSTGNARVNVDETFVRYPASLSSTIAVGAMSPCGERKNLNSCDGETWWKSCYGTEIDVVAPGVLIPTTTINSDYIMNFNGTSAACPHASGVMALILSVNPCLTAAEARAILCKSCDKLSDYKYCNSTYGFWNQEVGYGKINAYKAVLMAFGLVYEKQVTGIVGQPTSSYNWLLSQSGCTGLTNASYSVQRYEVTKTITFPYTENPVIQVSTNGFSAASPNQGNNYYNITNITHTSADVKTWKYKIITNNGGQTYIPSGDVWFKYIVYDDTAPTVYVSNKTVSNTTYNRTAIEKLVMTNFTVQGNSNVELRAGEEIIFNTETSIKPTSTGIVHANAEPFVSCENNREIQNESSDLLVSETVVLKSFSDENTVEITNDIENDIIPVVLFPNPAKDEITVRFNNEIGDKGLTITVNNSSGNKIEEITSTDKETPINVLHYSNGVYLITVRNNEDVYRKTFIKK